MLRTLRHGFLKEALDFAGVHRERLAEVSTNTGILLSEVLSKKQDWYLLAFLICDRRKLVNLQLGE